MKQLLVVICLLLASQAFGQQPVNNAQTAGTATSTGNGTTGAGSQRVTIASDNTAFAVNATLQSGSNQIGHLEANQSENTAQINGVTPLMGNGTTGTGSLRVTIASDNTAFAVNATLSAETTKVIGTVNQGTSPWVVSSGAATSGGTTASRFLAAASNNATRLKASAGQLYSVDFYNNAATPRYLKFYNETTNPPVPGSDNANLLFVMGCQAGLHCAFNESNGIVFGTGIGYALVTGISDTDNTSVAASDALINIQYK